MLRIKRKYTILSVSPCCQVRPMWSRQGLRSTPPPEGGSFHGGPAPALRPFSSSCDQLGRPMSRRVLSRSTTGLKPQQFDTTQRRSEYTCALVGKREARLSREAGQVLATKLVSSFIVTSLEVHLFTATTRSDRTGVFVVVSLCSSSVLVHNKNCRVLFLSPYSALRVRNKLFSFSRGKSVVQQLTAALTSDINYVRHCNDFTTVCVTQ